MGKIDLLEEFEPNLNGILYTKGYKMLYSVSTKSQIEIDSRCEVIFGESSYSYAFKDVASTLTSFSFQSNPKLRTIQNYAFYYCTNLISVNLSMCTQLTEISDYAFYQCSSIESFKLPSSIASLGNNCLENAKKAKRVNITCLTLILR